MRPTQFPGQGSTGLAYSQATCQLFAFNDSELAPRALRQMRRHPASRRHLVPHRKPAATYVPSNHPDRLTASSPPPDFGLLGHSQGGPAAQPPPPVLEEPSRPSFNRGGAL